MFEFSYSRVPSKRGGGGGWGMRIIGDFEKLEKSLS